MATFSCISTTLWFHQSSLNINFCGFHCSVDPWNYMFIEVPTLMTYRTDRTVVHEFMYPWKWNWNFLNPRKLVPANIDETTMSDYYLTLSHFLKTSSWNSKNLSLIGWEFTGRDRKWVKGSFRRTESTITSIRVLAETTPFLSGPVITEINKLPECFSCSHFKTFL